MNREIKFRAQVIGTKEWVYGFYFSHQGVSSIFIPEKGSFTVIPETVGQFTGMLDKNGVEIYEGDLVNSNYFRHGIVEFWDFGWYFKNIDDDHHSFRTAVHSFEVIGNVHLN